MCSIRFPAFGRQTRNVLQYLTAKGATVMSKNEAQVLEKALALPPDERAELADRLLVSLDTERQRRNDDLWAEEAENRIDAFERGEIRAVSAKEAFETNKGAKP
jgi:putative addiction module component (TIGR02574 family)